MFRKIPRKIISMASKEIITCKQEDSVSDVMEKMLDGYRKIPVLDSGKLKGIITIMDVLDYLGAGLKHRDFKRRKKPLEAKVSSLMNPTIAVDAYSHLENVVSVFKEYRRGSFPVVRAGKVVGIISEWDFLKNIRGNMGVKVKDAMIIRPVYAKENYTVEDAAKMMVRGGYRRLPVTKLGYLTGVVVPWDVLLHYSKNRSPKALVREIMQKNVKTISQEEDIGAAARVMLASRIGGLPVVEDEELVGILTESDIVHSIVFSHYPVKSFI